MGRAFVIGLLILTTGSSGTCLATPSQYMPVPLVVERFDEPNTVDGDKILHFLVSQFGTVLALQHGQRLRKDGRVTWTNRVVSSTLMLGVGYAKEAYDARQRGQKIDQGDMIANTLGIITGNLLVWDLE